MSELFLALSFLFVIVLIVGLFKPSLVLRWAIDENINRKSVLKYYGLAFIGMFILSSITMPFANNKNLITNQAKEDPELEEGIEDEELGQDEGEGEDKDEKSGDEGY